KFDRVRAAFIHSCKVSTIYCTILAVAGFIFARQLVSLFVESDPEVSRMGTEILRYQCLAFPLTGYVVMVNMYLQNIRRTVPATIMAMSRQGIFLIPALFLGNLILGFLGVEIAQAVADTASFLLAIPLGLHALNSMGVKN
ncbi:MAG: MATE family efflux transporter, partial [Muribaculaceae bacterium]|nr:MATE family efflux transporter [Muribaculaceae bacterium]